MGASCFIVPTVQNNKGEHVPSKLFEDLWKLSSNYEWASTQYKIATDSSFLESVSEDAIFDKNGQIDARSFMDITGITYTSDTIKEKLSKRWEESSLPTEEVSSKVSEFNSEEELKNDFVPVVNENEGSTVSFTVAQRTPDRVAALQTYLENNETIKIITSRLKQLGVAYDFVGSNSRYHGRFSTQNAQKAFDGLYHLIEIAGGANVQETLVEESAHLATLACKDSTFINRLLDTINENTAESLFTPEELERGDINTYEGKLELAGILVAKAMSNQLQGEYKGFLSRVKQAIYKVFAKSSLSSLLSEKARAKVMAETLAHGFLFNPENFSVEKAVSTPSPITLYRAKSLPENARVVQQVLNKLKQLGARIDNFSKASYNDIYRKLIHPEELADKTIEALSDDEIGTITGSSAKVLIQQLRTVLKKLEKIDTSIFDKQVDIDTVNAVFEAAEIFEALKSVGDIYYSCVGPLNNLDIGLKASLEDTLSSITSVLSELRESVFNYINWYSLCFMRETIGRDTIDVAARVFLSADTEDHIIPRFSLEKKDERSIHISTFLTTYLEDFSDSNRFVTFFRTYGNNKDITTQVFYDAIRQSKAAEAINYNNEGEVLDDLENRWKDFIRKKENRDLIKRFGFDPDTVFFERTKSGKITGSFLGRELSGQLEEDRKNVLKVVKGDFRRALEGTLTLSDGTTLTMAEYKALTKAQKFVAFEDFKETHPAWIAFEDDAYLDKTARIRSNKYINQNFIDLCNASPEFAKLFNEIVAFKQHLDDTYLVDLTDIKEAKVTHGVHTRVPQFKAKFIERVARKYANARQKRNDLSDPSDLEMYCEDITSEDFGSRLTEPVALSRKEEEKAPELDRLALYGINLLEDTDELSTDIFRSLDKYLEMACRYSSSQGVVTKLEVFNHQLERRQVLEGGLSEKSPRRQRLIKSVSSEQRTNMLDRFIYVSKGSFWKGLLTKSLGPLAAFGAIRALCISGYAYLKNLLAGYRVLVQDVASGVYEGVTLKDVMRATLQNMSPRHVAYEIARVVYGQTLNGDQYQRLVDRWDSYRTPAKIHKRKGLFSIQTLVNVMMANYSLSDNALIGIIYNSKLGATTLYDANSLNAAGGPTKTTAADAYKFLANGTPILKEGLLKDPSDFTTYRFLKDALTSISSIIKTNEEILDKDLDDELIRLDDKAGDQIRYAEDFFEYTLGKELPVRNADGTYKKPEEVKKAIKDEIAKITYTEQDEFNACSSINDYIISSQGVYGMLNATQFQSNAYTQTLGKIKGYMFGILQRNFFSNYSISQNKFKSSMLGAYSLALFATFADAKELADEGGISVGQFRRYMATAVLFPFALKSKTLRDHLTRCGWDPDQLSKLFAACLGFWINWCLGILARCLYRGNEKKIGNKVYSAKGKVKLKNSIMLGMDPMVLGNMTNRLVTPGILFPDEAKLEDVNPKTGIPRSITQKKNWEKSGYMKSQGHPEQGTFVPGSQEFYDRMAAYDLKNIVYDKDNPLYYMTGFFYRLTRGIRDEGLTLMNPTRFANDAIEMVNISNAIALSSGLTTLADGVIAFATSLGATGDKTKWVNWNRKECKFWLNKIGLTYDGDGPEGDKVQIIDWYDKQEIVDTYSDRQRAIFQITR